MSFDQCSFTYKNFLTSLSNEYIPKQYLRHCPVKNEKCYKCENAST